MKIYFTKEEFEFLNPYTNEKETTNKKIPFIINWDYKLEEDINQFLLCKTLTDWNPDSKTPKNNAENLISFLNFCFSINKKWQNISSFEIRKWIEQQTENKISSGTIKSRISTINSLFDFSFTMNIISKNPFEEFNLRENKILISQFSNQFKIKHSKDLNFKQSVKEKILNEDVPTKKEIKLFYSKLNEQDKLMASLILETGVRKDELLQLTIKMIINAKISESENFYILTLNAHEMKIKNNKSRNIILTNQLMKRIKEHLNTKEYKNNQKKYILKNNVKEENSLIFISNRGNKFSPDKLNKSFKKASLSSGYLDNNISYIKPHVLRHCFASYYIKEQATKGHNIENSYMYISERLGHSNMEVTKKHYIKIVNKEEQHKEIAKHSLNFINDILG